MKNKKIQNIKNNKKLVFYLKFIFALLLLIIGSVLLGLYIDNQNKKFENITKELKIVNQQKGEKGNQGPRDEAGDDGAGGFNGKDGAKGKKGDKGNTGPQGSTEAQGDTGAKGADGTKGDWAPNEALNKLSMRVYLLENPETTERYEKFKNKISTIRIYLKTDKQNELFKSKDKGALIDTFSLSGKEKADLKKALGIK